MEVFSVDGQRVLVRRLTGQLDLRGQASGGYTVRVIDGGKVLVVLWFCDFTRLIIARLIALLAYEALRANGEPLLLVPGLYCGYYGKPAKRYVPSPPKIAIPKVIPNSLCPTD